MIDDEKSNLLRKFPPFSALSDRALAKISKISDYREYRSGETLFIKDDPGLCLYLIKSGEIELFNHKDYHEKQSLGFFREGNYLGELNLLTESNRMATAIAISDTKVLVLFRPDLLDLLATDSEIGSKVQPGIVKLFVEKILQLNDEFYKIYDFYKSVKKKDE